MQRRRPGRAGLTVAFAIAATLTLAGPALPQDPQSEVDAYAKNVDAEAEHYLQKHPVRPSSLFDSVSSLVGTLGEVHAMAIDECESAPVSRDWQDAVPRLHENTIVALNASFTKGMKKYRAAAPARQTVVDQSLCAEQQWRSATILRDLEAQGPALRKQGY
ncbi:MAG: hypothetical protein ABSA66_15060 [Roseiarcus sp.]|jgi:hypothetical protein